MNYIRYIKSFMEKKIVKEKIKKEFIDSLVKYIVWTLPLALIIFGLEIFNDNVLYPDMQVNIKDIEMVCDMQAISPENPSLPGREFIIGEENVNHYAPNLRISLSGKGQIGKAYIIYNENDELLVQRVAGIKNRWTGICLNPKELEVTVNYSLQKDINEKRFYLVLIDKKTSEKEIWCAYVNAEKQEVTYKSSDEIYSLMLYEDTDKFSIGKEEIQKEIGEIYKLTL